MNIADFDLTKVVLAIIGVVTPLVIGAVAIFKKLVNDLNKQNNAQQLRTEEFYKGSLLASEKREQRLLDTTEKFAYAHQQVAESIYALTESTKAMAAVVERRNAVLDILEHTVSNSSKDIDLLRDEVAKLKPPIK